MVADYFGPFTLHQRLLSSWFRQIQEAEEESRAGEPEIIARSTERDRVGAVLDAVRDDPLQPRQDSTSPPGTSAADLVRLTLELLHVR